MKNRAEKPQQLPPKWKNENDDLFVPNWLLEVFSFIKREELFNNSCCFSLCISCRIFHQLCSAKLFINVRPHRIPYLAIQRHRGQSAGGKFRATLSTEKELNPLSTSLLPIPSISPPEYIIGFGQIDLMYLDGQVIEFLRHIWPLLYSIEFILDLRISRWTGRQWIPTIGHLLKMFFPKIDKFKLQIRLANLAAFDRLFPGVLSRVDCMDVELDGTNLELLVEWLVKMRPLTAKILFLNYNSAANQCQEFALIELIKEEFICSNAPLCFCILPIHFHEEFTLENERTGEMLRLVDRVLVRQPQGNQNIWANEHLDFDSAERNDGKTTIYLGIKKLWTIIKSID